PAIARTIATALGETHACHQRDCPKGQNYSPQLHSSMSHLVEDNVDCQWVSNLFGEVLEIIMIVSRPFPTIPIIGVAGGNHHHAAFIVENGAMMDLFAFLPIVILP